MTSDDDDDDDDVLTTLLQLDDGHECEQKFEQRACLFLNKKQSSSSA